MMSMFAKANGRRRKLAALALLLAMALLCSGCDIFAPKYIFVADKSVEERIAECQEAEGHWYKSDTFLFNNMTTFFQPNEDGTYDFYTRNPLEQVIYKVTDEHYEAVMMPSLMNICPVKINGKWGYQSIDVFFGKEEDGTAKPPRVVVKQIAPCEYDLVEPFNNKYGAVKKDGLYGFVDMSGELVIPFQYLEATYFTGRFAAVKDENGWCFINTSNERVTDYYEELEPMVSCCIIHNNIVYNNNMAAYRVGDKWGLLNNDFGVLLEPQFDDIFISYDEKIVYVNEDGKWRSMRNSLIH